MKEQEKVAVEFLGDRFHGHLELWKYDESATSFFGPTYKSLFINTEKVLRKLRNIGYKVFYIWESDYKKWNGVGKLIEKCHEFEEILLC